MARNGKDNGVGRYGSSREDLSAQLQRLGTLGTLFSVHFKSVELHLSRAIATVWDKHQPRNGTTAALALIVSAPGISQNELAQTMLLDKSGVTAIVNILERLGWAERRRSADDKRRNALHATTEGVAVLDRFMSEMRGIEARMLAGLSTAEQQQLTGLLDRLHASMIAADLPQ